MAPRQIRETFSPVEPRFMYSMLAFHPETLKTRIINSIRRFRLAPGNSYNEFMARGWESKSVESQMDAAEQSSSAGPAAPLTEAQKSEKRQRETLLLARTNLVRQLEATANERHAQALRQALSDLDAKIGKGST